MQLIGNIVKALVAFGTAMAPIASKLLDFITNLAGFIAKSIRNTPSYSTSCWRYGYFRRCILGFNGSDCCYK